MAPAPPSTPLDPALLERPFEVQGPEDFNALALDLFRLHAARNPVYRGFLEALHIDPATVRTAEAIPFLPIGFFRNQRVLLEGLTAPVQFTSSGTTGAVTSTHHVPWPDLYERSFLTSFAQRYGDPTDWRVLALLPAYLERPGSSLVHMARTMIAVSRDPQSGTYLYDRDRLAELLRQGEAEGRRTLTLSVRAQSAGAITIEVADSGVGIHADVLPRLFEFGFTTRKDGHGFGLHTSAILAKELGGELTAHSDGPDRGARFRLRLPGAGEIAEQKQA